MSTVTSTTDEHLQAAKAKNLKAYSDAGFQQSITTLSSGERVPYLERGASGSVERVCVFLHGMTSDALGSAAGVIPAAASLPSNVRVLVPDSPGHGDRKDWTQAVDTWLGYDRLAHVADLADFLDATGVEEPLDLVGYSMGGGTAYEFASTHTSRVRSLSLLAPGLVLAPDQYESTLLARHTGEVDRCIYNYRTEEEAMAMMRLVGYAEALVPTIGRLMASLRPAYPRDYWWHMWHAYGEVPPSVSNAAAAVDVLSSRLAECGEALKTARLPVLVVQGSEERVIHHEVPALLQLAVGPTCEVHTLQGFGHRGHPTDQTKNFLTAAGVVTGKWLATCMGYP